MKEPLSTSILCFAVSFWGLDRQLRRAQESRFVALEDVIYHFQPNTRRLPGRRAVAQPHSLRSSNKSSEAGPSIRFRRGAGRSTMVWTWALHGCFCPPEKASETQGKPPPEKKAAETDGQEPVPLSLSRSDILFAVVISPSGHRGRPRGYLGRANGHARSRTQGAQSSRFQPVG